MATSDIGTITTHDHIMKEFDYDLDYKSLDFTDEETRKLYRIGRGEQGVLLVRPYTDDICAHWRFKTPEIAVESSNHIFGMYLDYRCLLYTSDAADD